jgi:hypothetical protein
MDRFLHDFDRTSFWLGFLAGFLFLWLLGRLKPLFVQLFHNIRNGITTARLTATAGADIRLRNEALLRAQSLHLAASLFSLDEILVTPRLMVPPAPVVPGEAPPEEDIATLALPYMPDWPEMAALFRAPVISLAKALEGGASVVLIGLPGSGKTIALADLASRMARREPLPGKLEQLTPLFLHTSDINLTEANPEAPVETLIAALTQNAALLTQARLPDYLELALQEGRALLLLDGVDELPHSQVDEFTSFLEHLKRKYPSLHMVVTASLEYHDGLAKLGCVPLAVAAWDTNLRTEFIQRWSELWNHFVDPKPEIVGDGIQDNDRLLTDAWLLGETHPMTPLELTLKVWAAHAGDQLGPSLPDAIEAFLRRMAFDKDLQPIPRAREALEQIALQMVLNGSPVWTSGSAQVDALPKTGQDARVNTEGEEEETVEMPADIHPVLRSIRKVRIAPILPALIENGLLKTIANSRVRFSHLEICAYLAGSAISELLGLDAIFNRPEWLEKPAWDTRNQTMGYFLIFSSSAPRAIERYLGCDRAPLHQHLLSAARWLQGAPVNVPWRNVVMRKLVAILQVRELAACLRGRALTAMVKSNTPGVQSMLHQMSASQDVIQRQLAAMGAGLYYDDTIASDKVISDGLVGDTSALLADSDHIVRRAACLGLVAIGSRPALEAVADALLTGDDELREFAAEALANNPEEGHPTLREGTTIDDVLARRAVVHGLLRVRQPWAVETLQKMQLEDQQWVVQNAAGHALDQLNLKDPHLPRTFPPLTETPWLIAFAGEHGIGVSPGKPAYELLLKALREGREEQQLAALDYLRQYGDETAAGIIHEVYQEYPGELRESAFNTLWHLSAAGISLNNQN